MERKHELVTLLRMHECACVCVFVCVVLFAFEKDVDLRAKPSLPSLQLTIFTFQA